MSCLTGSVRLAPSEASTSPAARPSLQPDLVNTRGVLVNGAPGTDVTGNTIHTLC